MLKRVNKLNSVLVRKVIKEGTVVNSSYFRMFYQEGDKGRFAVVVSKKIQKGAVARNRIRRRVMAVLREGGFIDLGFLGVIFVKKAEILGVSAEEMRKDLDYLFSLVK